MTTAELPQEATRRLQPKKQTLDDAYAAPANFLEIDVVNPITHGVGRTRFTDYEVRMRVSGSEPAYLLSDATTGIRPILLLISCTVQFADLQVEGIKCKETILGL